MRITILGTLRLGSPEIQKLIFDKGIDYIFSLIKPDLSSSNIILANLESLFTKKLDTDNNQQINPAYLRDFKRLGINAFHVLNKYSYDYGMAVINDSNIKIQSAGINTIGNYEEPSTIFTFKNNFKFGILGYALYKDLFSIKEIIRDIKVIGKKVDRMLLVLNYGKENSHYSKKDRELFESFEDAEIDVVVGYHPFTAIQGYQYKSTYIIPSVGTCLVKEENLPFNIGSIYHIDIEKEGISNIEVKQCILNSVGQIEILENTNKI